MSGFVYPYCNKNIDLFGTGNAKKAAQEMGVPFLGEIPLDPDIVKLCDDGKAFVVFKRNSNILDHFEKVAAAIEKYSQTKDNL